MGLLQKVYLLRYTVVRLFLIILALLAEAKVKKYFILEGSTRNSIEVHKQM
jgi:hypothetical protein